MPFLKKDKKDKGQEEAPAYSNKEVQGVKFSHTDRSHASSSTQKEGPNKLQKKNPNNKEKGKETK